VLATRLFSSQAQKCRQGGAAESKSAAGRRKRAGRPESRRKAAITRQAREIEELSKKQSTRFKAVSTPGSPKLAVAAALATDFLPELKLQRPPGESEGEQRGK